MFLKVYGLTMNDVRKVDPVVGHRYDKTYRAEALEELYNEFAGNNKNTISGLFTESGYDYLVARNALLTMGPTMKKPRIASVTSPNNPYLLMEIKYAKGGLPKHNTNSKPAEPKPAEPKPAEPKPAEPEEAAPPKSETIPVSYSQFVEACAILGLKPEASKSEVKEAFKKLALATHTDKTNNDDASKFQTNKNAYDLANRFFNAS
jgi:hypothetical protein